MQQLRLLGGASLEGPDGPVGGRAAQRRRLALLAVLAVEQPRAVARDRLIGLLWPEASTERARHLLRDSLYVLRGALGDAALDTRGDDVRLERSALRCDLWDFEDALARGDAAAAVGIWTGPFLDGVFVDGADEFERWAGIERGRLSRSFAAALESAAEHCERNGDPRAAAEYWRRLADEDPCSTHVALRLMRALDAAGNRAAALRHAAAHEELMRAEFGAAPGPEIAALTERLRVDSRYSPGADLDPATDAPAPVAADPLASLPPPLPRDVAHPGRRGRPLVLLVAALIAATALAAAVTRRSVVSAAAEPRRVVVMPLENRTGDASLDVVGSIAADWITQGLAASGVVEVVSLTTALTAARHVAASVSPAESLALPRAMAAETGAGTVVVGSFVQDGDSIRLQVRIVDGVGGRVIAAPAPVSAEREAPLRGIEALRESVLAELATSLNPQLRMHTTGATRPPTYQAYQAYAEGIARVIDADSRGALEPLRRAAALDSSFTLPLVVLGMMHFNLGEHVEADSIARLADRSRHRLAPVDRALLDLLGAWLRQDHAAAYQAARAASALAPGSMATVQMGIEARRLNRPREALRILTALDPERGELRGDPFYWWDLTAAHHQLGEHRAELRAAQRGRTLAPDHLIVRLAELRALAALGRTTELITRLNDALTLSAGEVPPHLIMRATVDELRAHGHERAARAVARHLADWHAALPPETRASGRFQWQHVDIRIALGQWTEAETLLRDLAEGGGSRVRHLGLTGVLAARQGRHDEARQAADSLAALAAPWSWGAPAYWRAAIAAQLGEHDAALALLREAIARGRLRDDFHTEPAFEPLRRTPAFRALLRPAD